jgi:hypothetical protein
MGESIQAWFKAFYATSDEPHAHEKYTAFYTQDARFIMGDKVAVGAAGTPLLFFCSVLLYLQ